MAAAVASLAAITAADFCSCSAAHYFIEWWALNCASAASNGTPVGTTCVSSPCLASIPAFLGLEANWQQAEGQTDDLVSHLRAADSSTTRYGDRPTQMMTC